MSLIKPFTGLRPADGRAEDVVAPPYDVMNAAEARKMVEGRPWSFLHISRPEVDLPEDVDPYAEKVYAKAAENLKHMIKEGVLTRDKEASYYIYRLTMGEHVQTGLVAAASVDAYDADRIKKHEFTRPVKEDDRVRQVEALNAQTGPVFLVYKANKVVDDLLAAVSSHEAHVDVTAKDGVRHEIWVMSETEQVGLLTSEFNNMDALYVADGHHRSAAASRVAATQKENNENHTGEEDYNYFLSVVFPHDQMQILDYNRVIRDLNGMDKDQFLLKVEDAFIIEASAEPVKPGKETEFGMYLDKQWYKLTLAGDVPNDPVARLDISLLSDNLINPILGVSDPRRDTRIDFIGGIRGLSELEKRVDSGDWAVAFSFFPTTMEALMSVADAGEVMPPKSTWFEPKLADGLVSHVLD